MIVLPKVIAIDGPSASGKGTLALKLANELGWPVLDSGAIYRLIGLLADRLDLLDKELNKTTLSFETPISLATVKIPVGAFDLYISE